MNLIPEFASIGNATGTIPVRLSYRIIELFSEGLYSSPNKAIEELVANSFDAGALRVHVLLSPDLQDQDATVAVIDDGMGMDARDLTAHWLIGRSNKRSLGDLPKGRQQIGKFGIGKLATYVLARRLTHITKTGGRYYSTSMDYSMIDRSSTDGVEPVDPINIPVRELTEADARVALKRWTDPSALGRTPPKLFGDRAPETFTVAIMSSLKRKVRELRPGYLGWVLRTALPLRPDFQIWLNGKRLESSKKGKGLLASWTLGEDLADLPRPCPRGAAPFRDDDVSDPAARVGLEIPGLGRVTGYAEAYSDLLTGKSDQIGRSHGFFVYVFGRLVNVTDGHFGIPPNQLRHGTFGRFRLVVHINALDEGLRSNRETIAEGPLLTDAQDFLRAVFNRVRTAVEVFDAAEKPEARLARRISGTPKSLSRRPIVELARMVIDGSHRSRYLVVPEISDATARDEFMAALEARADDEHFVTGLLVDYRRPSSDTYCVYDTATGVLHMNALHPFVATFHDSFVSRTSSQPLQLLALADILAESQLHLLGADPGIVAEFVESRDSLLRSLANESGHSSALSIANNLREARNSADGLELAVCDAFRSLGFEVTPLGKSGKPDGLATAHLSAELEGRPRSYRVSLESKSTRTDGKKVSAKTVGISTIARQRDAFSCDHAVVVGPAFPTTQGMLSALGAEITADRVNSEAKGSPRTITLITIDDLANLVQLRPLKQVGLLKLRELLLKASLPGESRDWVREVEQLELKKPPYREILETIDGLHHDFPSGPVTYSALRVALFGREPKIKYEGLQEIADLCRGMAQMAPGFMYATANTVELDQSVENIIATIDAVMTDLPQMSRRDQA